MDKSNKNNSTETTISVNWSGGGMIKETGEQWTIETLKNVAAGFPDMVAITPQRTYAILTKYTSLESFHRHKVTFSPLSYENAGVYTNSLMEHYMDYKSLWKQISSSTYELESNRASIEMAQPSQDVYALARVQFLPKAQIESVESSRQRAITEAAKEGDSAGTSKVGDSDDSTNMSSQSGGKPKQSQTRSTQLTLPSSSSMEVNEDDQSISFKVFPPTFAGLIQARQVCRWEMGKIVNEVDLVTKDPTVASDGQRDLYFLNPLIFKQLLPVVRSVSAQDAVLDVKNPNAALLLGYAKTEVVAGVTPELHECATQRNKHDGRLGLSLSQNKHKSVNYRMLGCAGGVTDIHAAAEFFNDLDSLDATYYPEAVDVWIMEGRVVGIKTRYTNSKEFGHGQISGQPTYTLTLSRETSEVVTEVQIEEGVANKQEGILSLAMATSLCKVAGTRAILKPAAVSSQPGNEQPKPADAKANDATPEPAAASAQPGNENPKPADVKADGAKVEGVKGDEASARDAKTKSDTQKPRELEISVTKTHCFSKADQRQWSLRGFFGFFVQGNFKGLGTIWGKDTFVPVQVIPVSAPLARSYLGLPEEMQKRVVNDMTGRKSFASQFYIGDAIRTTLTIEGAKLFSTLDAGLDVGWQITKLTFRHNDAGQLTGIAISYANGREYTHGEVTGGSIWAVDTPTPLVGIKITAGKEKVAVKASKKEEKVASGASKKKAEDDDEDEEDDEEDDDEEGDEEEEELEDPSQTAHHVAIDKVELLQLDAGGGMPEWPLDLVIDAIRWLGHHDDDEAFETTGTLVEMAPTLDRAIWSVRGFWGETDQKIITRLGVIWGRSR